LSAGRSPCFRRGQRVSMHRVSRWLRPYRHLLWRLTGVYERTSCPPRHSRRPGPQHWHRANVCHRHVPAPRTRSAPPAWPAGFVRSVRNRQGRCAPGRRFAVPRSRRRDGLSQPPPSERLSGPLRAGRQRAGHCAGRLANPQDAVPRSARRPPRRRRRNALDRRPPGFAPSPGRSAASAGSRPGQECGPTSGRRPRLETRCASYAPLGSKV
jgi:hypothetical protein